MITAITPNAFSQFAYVGAGYKMRGAVDVDNVMHLVSISRTY